MVYKKPEKKEEKIKEVFDKKTGKNVFITVKKLLEDEGRYSGVSGKIKNLQNRLREISSDPKFTNEDREEIARQIRKLDSGKIDLDKLKSKVPGGTKKGIGPSGGAPVSKTTGKVFTGHKGTKRSIGPAGAPVSKTTGKVFAGANVKKRFKGGLMVKPKAAKRGY